MSTPRPLPPEVVAALQKGHLLEAIKRLRASGGFGLAEAKSAIEHHLRQNTIKVRPAADVESVEPLRQSVGARPVVAAPALVGKPGLSPGEVPRTGGSAGVLILLAVAAAVFLYLFFR